jgi:hypothetical protein
MRYLRYVRLRFGRFMVGKTGKAGEEWNGRKEGRKEGINE